MINLYSFLRYLTSTEWRETYGGKKAVNPNSSDASFRRLPFDHCSLSLQPFENPLCDTEGHLFDLLAIVPYLKKYKTNPVTGKVKAVIKSSVLYFYIII